MTRILHRVTKKQARRAPPVLPKEVTPTGPREYVDRFGLRYLVIWNGTDKYTAPSAAGTIR